MVSAKAFDVLERLDPNPEDWAGKRGACVGVVQAVLAGKEDASAVREVCDMLRGSEGNREAEQLFDIISNWAEGVGIMVAGKGGCRKRRRSDDDDDVTHQYHLGDGIG